MIIWEKIAIDLLWDICASMLSLATPGVGICADVTVDTYDTGWIKLISTNKEPQMLVPGRLAALGNL